jgi:hypothetical protein
MTAEPYASARWVFWIVDNGSSHKGRASTERLEDAWPNLRLIHLSVHASRLNQEILFWIAQRKVLQPNDFDDLATIDQRLLAFGRYYGAARRADPSGSSPAQTPMPHSTCSTDTQPCVPPDQSSPVNGPCEINHLGAESSEEPAR